MDEEETTQGLSDLEEKLFLMLKEKRGRRVYRVSELREMSPEEWKANRADILDAERTGRLIDDVRT